MGNNSSGPKHRSSLDDDPLSGKKITYQFLQDVYGDDSVVNIATEGNAFNAVPGQFKDSKMYDYSGKPTLYVGSLMNTVEPCNEVPTVHSVPTVFKWDGNGKDVYISGTFNGWKSKIPMVRSSSKQNFYTIIDLPLGEHQYKFIIDGQWKLDQSKPIYTSPTGIENNVIEVKTSDFDVLSALSHDMANSRSGPSDDTAISVPVTLSTNDCFDSDSLYTTRNASPPGDYNRVVPNTLGEALSLQLTPSSINSGLSKDNKKSVNPPLLPPQLLQVILNRDTNVQCDPNLLPQPDHVMVNHMYALSIKDSMIVLSAITRYRQKFVSTVMYKPI